MGIRINNYAKSMKRKGDRDYFTWRVFVDEPAEKLDQIKEVEYLLHSTFPEPYQLRSGPEDKFALETSGWGEFTILVTVRFKDGRTEDVKYHLVLDPEQKPWVLEST